MMRNKQKGFSLIELLIVVAIILIIAAIAIPNLLRSKIAANQASAVGSLRTLNTACIAYSTSYGQFPAALSNMGPISSGGTASSTSAELIDSVLAAGTKSGYTFVFTAGASNQSYSITATPITAGTTGQSSCRRGSTDSAPLTQRFRDGIEFRRRTTTGESKAFADLKMS